mmetsp:Transcript_27960/g.39316  ORF Transcript_27960/g.39316 Transcript_27960/m.39316 type:complete len:321 (-) Transcript_27960:12-974(-)
MKDHFRCRPDGRSSGGTLRPLACEMSCLQRADGSALWKAGSTSVLAAVYGPVAPRQSSKEDSSKAIITVLCKGSGTGTGTGTGGQNTATETSKNSANRESSSSSFSNNEWLEESSSSSSFLVDMLMACVNIESYKRSVIQIVLSIIQADGSVLACALHAAVAALLDAGIEMNCLPVATTCLLLHPTSHDSDIGGDDDDDNNETPASSLPLFLDPVEDEETIPNSSTITFVNDSEHPDKILGCQTKIMGGHVGGKSTRSNDGTTTVTNTNKQLQQGGGGIELETFIMSIEAASRASPAVVAFWRLAVEQKVTRESQTLWSS